MIELVVRPDFYEPPVSCKDVSRGGGSWVKLEETLYGYILTLINSMVRFKINEVIKVMCCVFYLF